MFKKALLLAVLSSSTFAFNFNYDFGMMDRAQVKAVKTDSDVLTQANGSAITAVNRVMAQKNDITYSVELANGCEFDTVVSYGRSFFSGVKSVDVVEGTYSCDL